MEQLVGFEEKKAILLSYDLKLKEDHTGRVSATYELSKQRGKIVACEFVSTVNGYINGNYMRNETIVQNGYEVDERGWINIKHFRRKEFVRSLKMQLIRCDNC